MAEEAPISFLLQLLKANLSAHFKLLSGVEEELNQLETDVKNMEDTLREPDGRRWSSRLSQKAYERRVRDVLHEAEDILDECFTRAALNESRWFNNKFVSLTHFRLANQVKSVRKKTIKRLFDEILPTSQPSPSTPITTDQPNGEITITHPSICNEASCQGKATTSLSLVNRNLEGQKITITPHQSEYIRPSAQEEASTSQSHVNENLIEQEITISQSQRLVNENLIEQEILRRAERNGSVHMDITITQPSECNGESSQGVVSASQSHVNGNLIEQETCMKRGSVVGFEEKAGAIISLLTKTSSELQVITITGMPGLGKSTLARKVYECERHRDYFSKVIWVDVTQKFDKTKVFLSILKSLTKEGILPGTPDDALKEAIKSYLENQKFLLIFDDVWNIEDWRAIETALPKGNSRGRVLITSRIESVAAIANWGGENCYNLDFLDENKSWDLLRLQVFDNLDPCVEELDGFGRKIAKGCGGLPLAIIVIAGVLLKIRTTGVNKRKEWERVANSVSEYFINGNYSNERTENLIALSCNEMTLDLRYCFLYLGIFPKESPIPIRRLIRLWIAEGFICRKGNKTLEELAIENLNELIDRNLVINNFKPDGYITTCSLHPLIREFCKKQASLENYNLFQEIETSSDGNFNPPISEIQNRRRICIHSRIKDFLETNPQGPRVHSLLCSAKEAVTSLPANTPPIPLHFKRLRVVDVTPIKLPQFPSKLDKLIHLRYIALSADSDGDVLWNLPKEVSRLWNLQSITIETNSRTFEIKANLWKMMHLRHLKTKAAIILPKKSKGPAGEQLQSVSRLSTRCCTEDVFNKAKNIQKLGIRGDLNTIIMKVSCLRKLHLLRKLKLVHDVYPKKEPEKPLSCLPNHDVFPHNLRILQLSGTFLPWNQIDTLEKLGGLEVLKLKNSAFKGKYWGDRKGCFYSLEILLIADTDLEVWTAHDSYFPKLKCLILKDCKQLGKIPFESTENSTENRTENRTENSTENRTGNLQILHVENVSESAVNSARKIADNTSGLKLIIRGGNGGSASNI